MILMVRSCLLAFIATCLAGPMSKEDLQEFDKNVRADLAVMIAENFEKLTKQVTSLNEDCMTKINGTIDQCASCPRGKNTNAGLGNIVSILGNPISASQKLATTIAGSLSNVLVQQFLGKRLKPVLGTLTGTFGAVINKNNLKHLTNVFSTVGKTLGKLKNSLSSIPSLVGRTAKNWVGEIGNGLSKLKFWRRKRSACAACGKLDSEDSNVIITNVCGASVAKSLGDLTKSIENLQLLYEDAINGTILTQIITGDPKMVTSPVFAVSAELQSVTYSTGTITRTIRGRPEERIVFTDKEKSYALLADKIYKNFV
ncbi:uncharacterized protein LOC125670456 [Ostrea edulis]|uniref:uncharacterized protein LOC125670456 n=1 Tax=Ostrea edulis TaxID=37623 RepID=UPI0020956ECA|nr:uncharacterized protein LOC125670456 [Ostrea edulis]